jgi:hypothetical protein
MNIITVLDKENSEPKEVMLVSTRVSTAMAARIKKMKMISFFRLERFCSTCFMASVMGSYNKVMGKPTMGRVNR